MIEAQALSKRYGDKLAVRPGVVTTGIPRRRVDEVIDLVGLREVANRRAGGFSPGTGQRLGDASRKTVRLRSPHAARLGPLLVGPGGHRDQRRTGLPSAKIGRIPCAHSEPLTELTPSRRH